MTSEEESHTLVVAQQFGDKLIRQIAKIGLSASPKNKRRIFHAFPEIEKTYGPDSNLYYRDLMKIDIPDNGISAIELAEKLPTLSRSSVYKLIYAYNMEIKNGPSHRVPARSTTWISASDAARIVEFANLIIDNQMTVNQLVRLAQ